jgi:RecB family exonuclease
MARHLASEARRKANHRREVGRPKIIPDLDTVRHLAAQGMTMMQIADALDISVTTLYERKAEYAEFANAFKSGKAEHARYLTSKAHEAIERGSDAVLIFSLKNIGWSDRLDLNAQHSVTTPDQETSAVHDFTPAVVKQAESVVALRERVLRQFEQDDEANTVEITGTTVELNGGFLTGGNGKNGKE